MKITSQVLFTTVSNSLILGNKAVTLDVIHQISIYRDNEGEIIADVELIDYGNVTFMGLPIEGYKAINKLKNQLLEWGINFDDVVYQECGGIINEEFIDKQIYKFKSIVG